MQKFSFRVKFFLLGFLPVLLLGAFIGIMVFTMSKDVVVSSQKQSLANATTRIDISLTSSARSLSGELDLLCELIARYDTTFADPNQPFDLFCQNLLTATSALQGIHIFQSHTLVYTTDTNTTAPFSGQDLTNLYAHATPNSPYWHTVTHQTSGQEVLVVSMPLSDPAPYLLVMELSMASLTTLLSSAQNTLSFQCNFMLDDNNQLVASGQSINEEWLPIILEHLAAGERRFTFYHNDKAYYCSAKYNALTHFTTYSLVEQTYLFPETYSLVGQIITVVSVCLGCILCFMFALYGSIMTPLKKLTAAMEEAKDHRFAKRLPVENRYELGHLIQSFNDMLDRMDVMVKEVYQQKLAQQNAEMEALQAQINPHFLYNTLDSINWMLIEREQDDVSDMVVALGNMMRYCMDTGTATVPLWQEFEYLQDYLSIQKCRLTQRLDYQLYYDPRLKDMTIPKLALQPLVENAIRHGIEPMVQGGILSVCAMYERGRIVIIVEDNGRGMDLETLTAMQKNIATHEANTIGLRNVWRRLQLYHGAGTLFHVSSYPWSGTCIIITIMPPQ